MATSNRVYTKKNRPEQAGTMVGVRLQPDLLELLDLYATQEGIGGRPEAVRAILRDTLATYHKGLADSTGKHEQSADEPHRSVAKAWKKAE